MLPGWRRSEVPVIAVVGWVVYNEPLEIVVAIGAALILAANTLNLRVESANTKRENA